MLLCNSHCLCLVSDPSRVDKQSMMMRFLHTRALHRFIPFSRVWTHPSRDSLVLSQNWPGLGRSWIYTSSSLSSSSSSSSSPRGTPPGDGHPGQDESADADPLQDQSMGLAQRFKRTFKQYGKVMIPVHLLTSCMWFGGFYYAAMK